MSEVLNKPDWIPWYVQRVKGSKAWKELKDFQFGWYVKLLTELADSAMPGYLPNDVGVLWKLAGAQTESFFKIRGGIELLARHFNRTEDGLWIYNERMLKVLHEQGHKRAKRRRSTISSLCVDLHKVPDWVPGEIFGEYLEMRRSLKKELKTARALNLAINTLANLKASGHDPQKVLEQSIFRSWVGLFPIEAIHGQANGTNGANGKTPAQGSYTPPSCGICEGSGWDMRTGKAARCECRAQAHAANGSA